MQPEYRYAEELPLLSNVVQRGRATSPWQTVSKTVGGWYKVVRMGLIAVPLTLSTIFRIRVMNNDKKTTIIGWVKGLLLGAGSIFFPELPGLSDAVGSLIQLILAALGIVEIVQGWLTNKADLTPEG